MRHLCYEFSHIRHRLLRQKFIAIASEGQSSYQCEQMCATARRGCCGIGKQTLLHPRESYHDANPHLRLSRKALGNKGGTLGKLLGRDTATLGI